MATKFTKDPLASQFAKASPTAKQRLIAASFGEVGTLKTSFWLTAPGPILVQSLDQGLEGVIEEIQKTKDIYVSEYEANTDGLEQDIAIETRDKFIEDFEYAIKNGIRTIVWDKETQVYAIFKYAEFGAPSSNPSDYYSLFQRYRRLINMAKASDINFGLIQGMQTPWVPKVNKKTGAQGVARADGNRERRGMAEIEELVHVNIEHVLEDSQFYLKIGKARGPGGQAIQNTTLPYCTFPELATLIFPDTTEEEWV